MTRVGRIDAGLRNSRALLWNGPGASKICGRQPFGDHWGVLYMVYLQAICSATTPHHFSVQGCIDLWIDPVLDIAQEVQEQIRDKQRQVQGLQDCRIAGLKAVQPKLADPNNWFTSRCKAPGFGGLEGTSFHGSCACSTRIKRLSIWFQHTRTDIIGAWPVTQAQAKKKAGHGRTTPCFSCQIEDVCRANRRTVA